MTSVTETLKDGDQRKHTDGKRGANASWSLKNGETTRILNRTRMAVGKRIREAQAELKAGQREVAQIKFLL